MGVIIISMDRMTICISRIMSFNSIVRIGIAGIVYNIRIISILV